MIVLGIVLLVIAWLLADAGVAVDPVIFTLLHDGGVLLIVIGLILLILSFFGVSVGRGIGPARNGRRYWY